MKLRVLCCVILLGFHFSKLKEDICSISTTLLTFPLGVIFFTVYYDPFHVYFELHSEECVLSLATIYGIIVWIADRKTLTISSGKGGVTKGEWQPNMIISKHQKHSKLPCHVFKRANFSTLVIRVLATANLLDCFYRKTLQTECDLRQSTRSENKVHYIEKKTSVILSGLLNLRWDDIFRVLIQ